MRLVHSPASLSTTTHLVTTYELAGDGSVGLHMTGSRVGA